MGEHKFKTFGFSLLVLLFVPALIHAQGMFEYGRGLEGVGGRRGVTGPSGPGAPHMGGRDVGSTRGLRDKSQAVPTALTVISTEASLYARQDEASDKILQLSLGETLVPIAQTVGDNFVWYMVKTQKGAIGWIKSTSVREASAKKQ